MRKVTYICGAIIIVTSMLSLLNGSGALYFILEFLPALVIYFCYPLCNEKTQYHTIQFFAIWVAGYDIVNLILNFFGSIDLPVFYSQVGIQFGVPFMVAMILKAKSGLQDK